jgi:hypothetical protein
LLLFLLLVLLLAPLKENFQSPVRTVLAAVAIPSVVAATSLSTQEVAADAVQQPLGGLVKATDRHLSS